MIVNTFVFNSNHKLFYCLEWFLAVRYCTVTHAAATGNTNDNKNRFLPIHRILVISILLLAGFYSGACCSFL